MNGLNNLLVRLLDFILRYRSKVQLNKLREARNVTIHSTVKFGDHSLVRIDGVCKALVFSERVSCRRFCNFLLYTGANLIIHKNVFFNNNCSVNCLGSIEIGENTIFGESVKIYDHNHSYTMDKTLVVARDKFKIDKVSIGSNCWIGSNVTILMGVTIGDNVIIGANSLIYKSIPSDTIVKHHENLLIEKTGQHEMTNL